MIKIIFITLAGLVMLAIAFITGWACKALSDDRDYCEPPCGVDPGWPFSDDAENVQK